MRRALLAVLLLAAAAYVPSLGNGFAWDDFAHIVDNESVHGLRGLPDLLTSPYLRDRAPARSPYRPVTSASFALSWTMGGGSPLSFHLFNVVAHVAATGLVLALLLALGASTLAAGVGAALFAVHPVHAEAVAGVVGRADVLLTIGALLATLAWLRRDLARAVRLAGVAVGCVLAVGSKETGVVVPALLVLLELNRRPETARWRGDERWLLGVAAGVVLAYLVTRRDVLGVLTTYDVAPYIAVLPDPLRVATAVANVSEVARLLVWPASLSVDYGPALIEPTGWTDGRTLVGLSLVGALTALAWRSWQTTRRATDARTPWLALALGWAVIAWALVSNLLVPVPMWLAERTLYLPSVAIALAAAGIAESLVRAGSPMARRAALIALALLVGLGTLRSWTRSMTWRDTDRVAATLAAEHPESFRAIWWVAGELMEAGLRERAVARYGEALAINPNDALLTLDYARALMLSARWDEAERLLRPVPRALHPSLPVYLAQCLMELGRMDEARAVVQEGLAYFPTEVTLRAQAERLGVPVASP